MGRNIEVDFAISKDRYLNKINKNSAQVKEEKANDGGEVNEVKIKEEIASDDEELAGNLNVSNFTVKSEDDGENDEEKVSKKRKIGDDLNESLKREDGDDVEIKDSGEDMQNGDEDVQNSDEDVQNSDEDVQNSHEDVQNSDDMHDTDEDVKISNDMKDSDEDVLISDEDADSDEDEDEKIYEDKVTDVTRSDESSDDENIDCDLNEPEEQRPKVISNDVTEGKTVFVKNIPFSATNNDLRQCMRQFGPVYYALICMDKLTEHSKGTGFVKFVVSCFSCYCLIHLNLLMQLFFFQNYYALFQNYYDLFQNKEDADECLKAGTELELQGNILDCHPALNKNDIMKKGEDGKKEARDSRNLYLVKEGGKTTFNVF